jgi:hypothetical protein
VSSPARIMLPYCALPVSSPSSVRSTSSVFSLARCSKSGSNERVTAPVFGTSNPLITGRPVTGGCMWCMLFVKITGAIQLPAVASPTPIGVLTDTMIVRSSQPSVTSTSVMCDLYRFDAGVHLGQATPRCLRSFTRTVPHWHLPPDSSERR